MYFIKGQPKPPRRLKKLRAPGSSTVLFLEEAVYDPNGSDMDRK
jgi:hypothetical protein